jgi:chitinase
LRGIATDIDVAALHLNSDGSVHLNDDPPGAAKFRRMWAELALLRRTGTRVEAMLGGAGVGSFANLHADFPKYYGLLRQTLRTYHFDGVDLDIEEPFALADTEHLIRQLRHDFGPHFVIAMAPVASDLSGQSTFSGGFSYSTLDRAVGKDVNWYNAQFYCGWGDLASTTDYDSVVAHGFSPARVVAGTVTSPANCGGYIDPATLGTTISALTAKYHSFAGVAGWEYFNSLGPDGPQSWYAAAKSAMQKRPA